jgi:hypothetical protein
MRLLLTLTDTETGSVVWSDRLLSPFDALVHGFDDVASKIAQSDEADVGRSKINQLDAGPAAREQGERIHAERERARLSHNLVVKRRLNQVRGNAR